MADSEVGPRIRKIPPGDERERLVCPDCGYVRYDNPKVVVGSVVSFGDRILLCRRAIPPSLGRWTLPAGYLELGETPEEGALREAWEEARALLRLEGLLAVYTLKHIGQVQLFYRATLRDEAFEAGPESLDVKLFRWDEIPWDDLAFPTVHWALEAYARHRDHDVWLPESNHRDETAPSGRLKNPR
ncbi:MAG: NUDIX hydrolase [Myxococcales bacterium]|nr:NUDIX hydrolase [Myxococcales bacterium]